MDREDRFSTATIRQTHLDAAIKSAGTHQRCIQYIRAVGGSKQDHTGVVCETIHLRQELVQRLFPFVIATTDACTALTAYGIDFINEHDAGRFLLGLPEEIPDTAGTDTHKQLDKLGGCNGEKRDSGFTSNCFR